MQNVKALDKWELLEQKVSKLYYSYISNKWNLEPFWENDFHLHLEKLSELNTCQGSCSSGLAHYNRQRKRFFHAQMSWFIFPSPHYTRWADFLSQTHRATSINELFFQTQTTWWGEKWNPLPLSEGCSSGEAEEDVFLRTRVRCTTCPAFRNTSTTSWLAKHWIFTPLT